MTYLPKVSSSQLLAAAFACAPLIGCATTQPPQELVDARAAYTRAEHGYARELSPASLHNAKVALDGAERNFEDDGPSAKTRDHAYVALRKAELANADGTTAHYQREATAQKQRASVEQAQQVQRTQAELVQTREQLASESQARVAAEQRAKDAMDRLSAANAAVKQEPRGTVITLSGNVLFASGKSQLLPGAQSSLNQVADALKEQSDKKIVVQGHTDSTGSLQTNTQLSQARAESVSSYLVTRGVASNSISAQGVGPSQPVADNSTPEGRANNRRVEIVIQNQEAR